MSDDLLRFCGMIFIVGVIVNIIYIIVKIISFTIRCVLNKIKKYKQRKMTIPAGTLFFNHDEKVKMLTKKDIHINTKKVFVTSLKTKIGNHYLETLDYTKGWGETKLEKQFIDLITDEYKNGKHQLIDEYIEEIEEY